MFSQWISLQPLVFVFIFPMSNMSGSFSQSTFGFSQGYAEKFHLDWSTYPVPKNPANNCIFCHQFHWSHLCLEVATLEDRIGLFDLFGLCFICGKRQHEGACPSGDIWCKWPQCAAKNEHNTTLCPNVPYPINEELVKIYKNHNDYVWELRSNRSMNCYGEQEYAGKKVRKRNRKLSSNSKTLTYGCHKTPLEN